MLRDGGDLSGHSRTRMEVLAPSRIAENCALTIVWSKNVKDPEFAVTLGVACAAALLGNSGLVQSD